MVGIQAKEQSRHHLCSSALEYRQIKTVQHRVLATAAQGLSSTHVDVQTNRRCFHTNYQVQNCSQIPGALNAPPTLAAHKVARQNPYPLPIAELHQLDQTWPNDRRISRSAYFHAEIGCRS